MSNLILNIFLIFLCCILLINYRKKKFVVYATLFLLALYSAIFSTNMFKKTEKLLIDSEHTSITIKIVDRLGIGDKYTKYEAKIIKLGNIKINKKIHVYIDNKTDVLNEDIIKCIYNIEELQNQRNPGGYNEKMYYYSNNIYGKIYVEKILEHYKSDKSLAFKLEQIIEKNIRNSIEKEYADFIIGMILGQKDILDDETKQSFTKSSLSHILVVSGSHLNYIILFISAISINKFDKSRKIIILIVIFIYVIITNFSISLVRPAIVTTVLMFFEKKFDIFKINILIALYFLVYNPYILFNLSFLLTFSAVFGIILLSNKIFVYLQLIFYNHLNRFSKFILKLLSVTFSVQIILIPIVSKFFHKIYILSIFSNIIAIPLSGILIILSILYTFLCRFQFVIKFMKPLIMCVIDLLKYISIIFANIPFSSIDIFQIKWYETIIYYSCLYYIFFLDKLKKEDICKYLVTKKKLLIKLTVIFIFVFSILGIKKYRDGYVTFIDVGQGDCILISHYGKNILIDGGGSLDNNFDVGERIVYPYLLSERLTKIDYIIVSHFDADHVNGLIYILKKYNVKSLIYYEPNVKDEIYNNIINIAIDRKVRCMPLNKDLNIKMSNYSSLNIYVPRKADYGSNNSSLICKFNYYEKNFLFMGDAEEEREFNLINEKKHFLESDVIKIGHHGSASSTTLELLEYVKPKYAIIQVGDNFYGHPDNIVLNRLRSKNIIVFRNDISGNIQFKLQKKSINIKTKIK